MSLPKVWKRFKLALQKVSRLQGIFLFHPTDQQQVQCTLVLFTVYTVPYSERISRDEIWKQRSIAKAHAYHLVVGLGAPSTVFMGSSRILT